MGAFLIQVLNGGLFFQAFQAYFKHLENEFGWNKTMIALAFTLSRAESGLLGPVQGWMVERYGTRLILQFGVLMYAAGFFAYANIDNLWQFYGAYLIMSLGSSFAGFITINAAIANWFDKKRARAMGLASVGWGVSGLGLPLIVFGLDAMGWRGMAFWSGVLVLATGIPLSFLFRHSPEPYGYLPDGEKPEQTEQTEDGIPATSRPVLNLVARSFSTREALKNPSFWYVSFGHASAMLAVSAVNSQFLRYVDQDVGLNEGTGAWIYTLLTTVMIASQLITGFLSERIPMRVIIVACMVGHTLALIMLVMANSVEWLLVFAVLHGMSWGFRGPLMVAIRADYFGRAQFATIMGFSSMVVQLGTMSGPLIAGRSFDLFESYSPAFIFMSFVTMAGAFLFAAARRPDPPPNLPDSAEPQVDESKGAYAAH